MKLAIINYRAGNIRSVAFALERLGLSPELTDEPAKIRRADKLIFPGVGEASSAMAALEASHLADVLRECQQPLLGICLGMQLLCAHSEEGPAEGLGHFAARVRHFPPSAGKVPHMGWNSIHDLRGPLFEGVAEGSYVYFVHSYYVPPSAETCATCTYGLPFSAALQRGNIFATQFHPEKSGATGEQILRNFLRL